MTDSGSPDTRRISRRTYLAAVGTGGLAGLAGCSVDGDSLDTEELTPAGGAGEGTTAGWSQHTRLTVENRQFGHSVALGAEGSTAVVTATNHDPGDGVKPGPAYVLERADDGWGTQAELTPDSGDSQMAFGFNGGSSGLSDDAATVLVGAHRADEPNGSAAGAAFVFERTDDGWSRQTRLVPDDGDRKDFFGTAVVLSDDGTTAIVGAWNAEGPDGEETGSAYVFEPTDSGWSQSTRLGPDDRNGHFGSSVALSGDTAIIGAITDANRTGTRPGAAYVFQREGSTWSRQAKLVANDGDSGDQFSTAVALEGNTAIIGAGKDEDPNGEGSGAAYVFQRDGGTWSQQAKLAPDDGDADDLFGATAAMSASGATALVGAPVDEDPNGGQAGSAYVFQRDGGSWSQQAKLAPGDDESHVFGRSVGLGGGTAIVGSNGGAAYVL